MTPEEQQALDFLESTHKMLMTMDGADEDDILRIAKTNGNVPWAAMTAYCDAHSTPHPKWPNFGKF